MTRAVAVRLVAPVMVVLLLMAASGLSGATSDSTFAMAGPAVAGAGPIHATAADTRPLDMADIITREVPSEPCISPDGIDIAFVVSRADTQLNRRVGDVWSVRFDSTTMAPPQRTRWTETPDLETELRWAPVGHVLGFRSPLNRGSRVDGRRIDSSDAIRSQVWIQELPAGIPLRLTIAPEGVESYRWLHDGSGVIYKTRQSLSAAESRRRAADRRRGFDGITAGPDSRPFEFRLQPISGGDPTLVTTVDHGLGDWDLSPDDQRIVYASNGGDPHSEESPTDLWLFDRQDGSTRRLTTRWGPDTEPIFTFDGGRIVWKADQDTTVTYSQEDVWTMAVDGSDIRCLSLGIDDALSPVGSCPQPWSAGSVLVERASRTGNRLTLLSLDNSGNERDVPNSASFVGEFSRPSDNHIVVGVRESSELWPEVWAVNLAAVRREGRIDHRVITDLEGGSPAPMMPRLTIMESVSADGFTTESLLALPDSTQFGPGPWPTITQLHGGPYNRNTARLRDNATALVLASHGYLVYMPNFRGSKGYGNAFGTATRGDFAEGPCRDVMAGLDSLIARGLADSSRLGIMGGSYGGYLTMWLITRSDRFKAAVSMYGFSSLITDFGNGQSPSYELEFLGEPYWKGNRLWTDLSPAWHVDQIHTPLLLLHGENDPAVGLSNSREMWTALTVLRKPVEFITYPREGHGFREPNHRIDAARRTVAWFDRWLR